MFPCRPLCWCLVLAAWFAVAQSAPSPPPVGEVFASDASVEGSVLLTGSGAKVMSGSAVTAGQASAGLRLTRGGEVRICSRTNISVTSSPNGRDLMLSMGVGAIEPQYPLAASADTIMTPDFRVLLPGPGNFHFALGVDEHGNTCVRTLRWNTASIIVSELIGDGLYQVKPHEEVLFRGGKISGLVRSAGACGCPAEPAPPVMRAQTPPPPPPFTSSAPDAPNNVAIQVDAPFIFRGNEPPPELDFTIPAVRLQSALVPALTPNVLPPAAPPAVPRQAAAIVPQKPRKGFFGKVKSFFGRVFR